MAVVISRVVVGAAAADTRVSTRHGESWRTAVALIGTWSTASSTRRVAGLAEAVVVHVEGAVAHAVVTNLGGGTLTACAVGS